MKILFTFLTVMINFLLHAQTIATLEDVPVPQDSFLNGRDANGSFQSANAIFPNDYNAQFDAWSGWAMSSKTDSLTSGFLNQYSAKAGGGFNNSSNYAVAFGVENSLRFTGRVQLGGFYITNNTYAYNSMRDGDQFSKRFGGETGNDSDFLRVTIYKYLNGMLSTRDSVVFYLADYRFNNNAQDYIIRDWTFVDLSTLGEADSLFFRMASSDVGEFGINTPTYFCLDNLTTTPLMTNALDRAQAFNIKVFPNPTADFIQISGQAQAKGTAYLFDLNGKLLLQRVIDKGFANIDLQHLSSGSYLLKIVINGGFFTQKIIKQ